MGTRRDFLREVAAVLAVKGALPLVGCGGAAAVWGPDGEVLGSIEDNHLHTARLTRAQMEAGRAVVLDITGTSDHPHFLHLSAQAVNGIRKGRAVSLPSSNDWGHLHWVHFNRGAAGAG